MPLLTLQCTQDGWVDWSGSRLFSSDIRLLKNTFLYLFISQPFLHSLQRHMQSCNTQIQSTNSAQMHLAWFGQINQEVRSLRRLVGVFFRRRTLTGFVPTAPSCMSRSALIIKGNMKAAGEGVCDL